MISWNPRVSLAINAHLELGPQGSQGLQGQKGESGESDLIGPQVPQGGPASFKPSMQSFVYIFFVKKLIHI